MSMNLGLGLGLGSIATSQRPREPLCEAIARKVCVTARDGDTTLKLAPHAVYKRTKKEVVTLDAVLLVRNDHPVNNPSLRTYRVSDLSEIVITDEGFTIDPSFEADDPEYAGRTVCIVQTV